MGVNWIVVIPSVFAIIYRKVKGVWTKKTPEEIEKEKRSKAREKALEKIQNKKKNLKFETSKNLLLIS